MPAKAKHRVIIDTNLWISFLLNSDFSGVDSLIAGNFVTLLFSEELIAEFVEVAQRPRFRKYFLISDIQEVLIKVRTKAELVSVTSIIDIFLDPKDNFVLALAQDGNASHLLTGDKDLLVLKKFGSTSILTWAEYLSKQAFL